MVIRTPPLISREKLDELYALYNHREFVYPDPLAFLYDYHGFQDREIVGLIFSSFFPPCLVLPMCKSRTQFTYLIFFTILQAHTASVFTACLALNAIRAFLFFGRI